MSQYKTLRLSKGSVEDRVLIILAAMEFELYDLKIDIDGRHWFVERDTRTTSGPAYAVAVPQEVMDYMIQRDMIDLKIIH